MASEQWWLGAETLRRLGFAGAHSSQPQRSLCSLTSSAASAGSGFLPSDLLVDAGGDSPGDV